MSFLLESVVYGAVVPAVAAAGLLVLVGCCCRKDLAVRYAVALGLVAGFVGAWVLFPWAALRPESHWHYLAYLAVAAAVAGPAGLAAGVHRTERFALQAVVALAAAWLLVPDWNEIEPDRPSYVAALAAGVFVLSAGLEPLPGRIRGPLVPAVLVLTAAAGAVVLVESGNLKFAQLAGAIAAAMLGCTAAARLVRSELPASGATTTFAVLLAGVMFAGWIGSFSDVPPAAYLLVAAAPLALWIAEIVPAANRTAKWKPLMGLAAVVAALSTAVVLALRAGAAW